MKKRILFVGEFSQVATGFGNIGKYLIRELYDKYSDQFEIAELACYLPENHPVADSVPWKIYGNQPDVNDRRAWEAFNSNAANEMGAWSFTKVLLDFQPHIVVTWRDPWFDNFINEHPYRRFFKFVHMPTCDGTPQKTEWLYDVMGADTVLTYSFWAKNVLERESNGKIKVFDVASPPIDTNVFKPLDRAQCRKDFDLPPDALIFGSCMRNQPRKLFPEIMRGFNRYLDICKATGRNDLVNNSYLFFHTTYPDLGWDFAEEIKRHHLGHKILFTLTCECGITYPSFFASEQAFCHNCQQKKASFPNTGQGVSREIQAAIYNTWDLLLQISIAEGFGMPINEAKACGTPALVLKHSAMIEQGTSPGGQMIDGPLFQEHQFQTGQIRTWVNPDVLGRALYDFACKPSEERQQMGKAGSEFVTENYSIANITSIWARAFDATNTEDLPSWNSPLDLKQPIVQNIPGGLPAPEFVKWCYHNISHEPEIYHTYKSYKSIQILQRGFDISTDSTGRPKRDPINYETFVKFLLQKVQTYNALETQRVNYFNESSIPSTRIAEI